MKSPFPKGYPLAIKNPKFTRREILWWGAAAAAGICAKKSEPVFASEPDRRENAPAPLSEFGYSQVQFAPGLLQKQFDENHKLLLEMDEDSLLRPFRVREGLPAPGT